MSVTRPGDLIVTCLEEMTAKLGTRVGKYFVADFTVRDVLEKANRPNTEVEQNYVRYKVAHLYPKSTIKRGQGDNGGFIHLVIWSR